MLADQGMQALPNRQVLPLALSGATIAALEIEREQVVDQLDDVDVLFRAVDQPAEHLEDLGAAVSAAMVFDEQAVLRPGTIAAPWCA